MSKQRKKDDLQLILKKKISSGNDIKYAVRYMDRDYVCTKEQCIKLIRQTPAQYRNCQTDGAYVSMKAGYGSVVTEKDAAAKKQQGVNIWTGPKYREKCDIFSNDQYFLRVMADSDFLKKQAKLIKDIDEAEVVNYALLKVETPFGIDSVECLSTGLKTLLNILYLKEKDDAKIYLVNIDECGENIIPVIFSAVNNTNIALYLSHYPDVYPEGYKIYANGKEIKDCMELGQIIRKEEGVI